MTKLSNLRTRRAAALTAGALACSALAAVTLAGSADAASRTATVTNLRTGGHSGYDRVVIDYKGRTPAIALKFVSNLYSCGSGAKLTLPGDRILRIDLTPAQAHKNNGTNAYTGPGRSSTAAVNLTTIKGVRVACDFEGHVTFGIGVKGATGASAGTLSDPKRIYVDVKR